MYIAILYSIWGFFVKSFTKNKNLLKLKSKVFMVKVWGVVAFSLVHEFLYGGDTVNYTKNSSFKIMKHFFDDPNFVYNFLFNYDFNNIKQLELAQQLVFGPETGEFIIVQFASVIGLLCFNTYSSIALVFGIFALSGLWAIFTILVKYYPHLEKKLTIACFYIPSVLFWSSGVLKDTLCLGAMGWLFWSMYSVFFDNIRSPKVLIVFILSFWLLKTVKVYIILCFMPALIFWLFIQKTLTVKNMIVRTVITPIFFVFGITGAFYGATQITKDDQRYNLEEIGKTTKATAEWIHYVSEIQGGSSYSLGELDGTFGGMLKLAPQAINVSLFRPYLWETRNIPTIISSLESMYFAFMTLYILFKVGILKTFSIIGSTPIVLFCFIFSLTFAFAVGISSYNFGTLVRYKIPLMPFYLSGLFIMESLIEKKGYKKKR